MWRRWWWWWFVKQSQLISLSEWGDGRAVVGGSVPVTPVGVQYLGNVWFRHGVMWVEVVVQLLAWIHPVLRIVLNMLKRKFHFSLSVSNSCRAGSSAVMQRCDLRFAVGHGRFQNISGITGNSCCVVVAGGYLCTRGGDRNSMTVAASSQFQTCTRSIGESSGGVVVALIWGGRFLLLFLIQLSGHGPPPVVVTLHGININGESVSAVFPPSERVINPVNYFLLNSSTTSRNGGCFHELRRPSWCWFNFFLLWWGAVIQWKWMSWWWWEQNFSHAQPLPSSVGWCWDWRGSKRGRNCWFNAVHAVWRRVQTAVITKLALNPTIPHSAAASSAIVTTRILERLLLLEGMQLLRQELSRCLDEGEERVVVGKGGGTGGWLTATPTTSTTTGVWGGGGRRSVSVDRNGDGRMGRIGGSGEYWVVEGNLAWSTHKRRSGSRSKRLRWNTTASTTSCCSSEGRTARLTKKGIVVVGLVKVTKTSSPGEGKLGGVWRRNLQFEINNIFNLNLNWGMFFKQKCYFISNYSLKIEFELRTKSKKCSLYVMIMITTSYIIHSYYIFR